jgi:hypothetical protein
MVWCRRLKRYFGLLSLAWATALHHDLLMSMHRAPLTGRDIEGRGGHEGLVAQ